VKIRQYYPDDAAAVYRLQEKQAKAWGKKTAYRFGDPQVICAFVCENDDGEIVAAVGARYEVELFATLESNKRSREEYLFLRNAFVRMWARIATILHGKGVKIAMAGVGPHLKAFGNALVKRGGFFKDEEAVYRFDVSAIGKVKS
jgi:hypothetical protein